MSHGGALLRGILERPADDTARLVYADWLQENGDELRAEFVRVQCRTKRIGLAKRLMLKILATGGGIGLSELTPGECWIYRVDSIDFADTDFTARLTRGFVSEIRLPLAAFTHHAPALFRAHPIERVTLTDRRQPWEWGEGAGAWWSDKGAQVHNHATLPHALFVLLTGKNEYGGKRYAVADDALTDLSRACVAYGRSLAGLSPLD